MNRWFLSLFFLFTISAFSKVDIPKNLSSADRIQTLEILGLGTNSRINTDNYPMGGYSGFEFGFTMNFVPVSDLSNLGDTVPEQDIFRYPIINIGKGIYNNIDLFIHFMPFSEGTGLSEYGGMVRWGFYQMSYLPISFSLLLSANSANINNQIITKNLSYDVIMGLTTRSLYLYLGGGQASTQGEFTGAGPLGITDTGNTEKESLNNSHILVGLGVRFEPVFVNVQMDYFTNPSYSLKLGLRY